MYGHLVLANTKSGFIPSAIKWVTNSQFSHSFVTVPDILSTPMCIEAAEGGVDMTRFDTSYADNQSEGYEIWNIKIDQSIKDAAIVSILADLEIGYGFLQFPWFVWRKLNLLFGREIKQQNNWDTNGMICSQLCVAYLKACGLGYVLAGYGNGSIAPQDLQDIFVAHPELFEKTESVRLSA
jgi:hypothetical protein